MIFKLPMQARCQRGQELDLSVGQLVVHGLRAPRGHHHSRAKRSHRLLAQEPASSRVLLASQVHSLKFPSLYCTV